MRSTAHIRPSAWLALAGVLAAMLAACGGGGNNGATQAEPVVAEQGSSVEELSAILATTDLGVGVNRVSFLLTTPRALVKAPTASISSLYLGDGNPSDAFREQARAPFHLWPYGVRGSYVTEMTFGRPGSWRLDIRMDHEEVRGEAHVVVDVDERGSVPQIGSAAPLSQNKTLESVGRIE